MGLVSQILYVNQGAYLLLDGSLTIHTLQTRLHGRLHTLQKIPLCQLLKINQWKSVYLLSAEPQQSEIFMPKADCFNFYINTVGL